MHIYTPCKFDHDIPSSVREDEQSILNIRWKTLGSNFCINEFKEKDYCFKKLNCKFNHEISEEDRRNPALAEKMKKKLEDIKGERNNMNHEHKVVPGANNPEVMEKFLGFMEIFKEMMDRKQRSP